MKQKNREHKLPRREFCALSGIAIASFALETACSGVSGLGFPNDGRLSARPRTDVKTAVTGQIKLGLNTERDAVLQVPKSAGQSPLPLLVMLHGATQRAEDMFWYLGSTPEEAGVAVLAPNSRGTTWDAIRNTFADDVNDLNRALERAFEKVAVDPKRVALGGFSDGATYAISLGLINGDLFNSVVAFSPGFVISGNEHGKPRFFISHGTHDHILPIDRCGRRIATELKSRGYEVNFRDFDGDHEIPSDVAMEGLKFISKDR
ncbi:MAG TPA: PHB depolymerase family esterase [Pyrinomonadaceae bacterium]|jgi:predicted esterase|nr:PHB depolymerase family esterase [Pyrinomonadaceae bacterium]